MRLCWPSCGRAWRRDTGLAVHVLEARLFAGGPQPLRRAEDQRPVVRPCPRPVCQGRLSRYVTTECSFFCCQALLDEEAHSLFQSLAEMVRPMTDMCLWLATRPLLILLLVVVQELQLVLLLPLLLLGKRITSRNSRYYLSCSYCGRSGHWQSTQATAAGSTQARRHAN